MKIISTIDDRFKWVEIENAADFRKVAADMEYWADGTQIGAADQAYNLYRPFGPTFALFDRDDVIAAIQVRKGEVSQVGGYQGDPPYEPVISMVKDFAKQNKWSIDPDVWVRPSEKMTPAFLSWNPDQDTKFIGPQEQYTSDQIMQMYDMAKKSDPPEREKLMLKARQMSRNLKNESVARRVIENAQRKG